MPEPRRCSYEGSDYQSSFWDQGNREYEDQVEAIALRRLLPKRGGLLVELGAGAGRNTPRYTGFERIVLLDYSRSQLEQAQARLGPSTRYVFVAADAYRLPFVDGLFDAATMIRVLHHMADAPRILAEVHRVLRRDGTFILEYANKRNIKAILRFAMGRQGWNPFSREPVEFAELNFDFHPAAVRGWLEDLRFVIQRTLTVSHFRSEPLKRRVPLRVLLGVDSALQWTGAIWQLTPSVFVKARGGSLPSGATDASSDPLSYFQCPACGHAPLTAAESRLDCSNCGRQWGMRGSIFDFREPLAMRTPGSA